MPKGENEFETMFKLAGDRFLEAMRYQFQSMTPRTYIDIQVITIMCHILNNEQNERFDKFVCCVSPEIMAGAPSIFNEGSCSLLQRYVNIPGQPNETNCGVFVMKWIELIDPTGLAASCEANKGYNIEKWGESKLDEFRKQIMAKILLNKDNEKTMETIRILNEMRNIRPAAVLRSPYVQVSSADLYSK
ncbi:hypothetical protein PIB30_076901 [Stylosanthes scabra]|uniref:Ubiquitin-like protease family profile domain-containing protein n=1 Tax=Stylosanthes scabra TaxID=79078 RepID=A0ABU6WNQ9_9FABA|nr:hypothetical protein [Stylosanthes scabra]